MKGSDPDEIVRSITTVASGGIIIGPAVAARMTGVFGGASAAAAAVFPNLSTREHDILELMADGQPNSAIANRLGLSEKTVRNNVSNIFTKLQVINRSAAIVKARQAGMGQSG